MCYDRGKKQRLYFHPYKPVSWLLTHLGILLVKNIRTNTTVTHSAAPHVPLFFSYHILTSSVIYYWTDVWQLGIYLLKIYIAAKQLYWRLWDGERPCTHRNISSWSVRHSANDRGLLSIWVLWIIGSCRKTKIVWEISAVCLDTVVLRNDAAKLNPDYDCLPPIEFVDLLSYLVLDTSYYQKAVQ